MNDSKPVVIFLGEAISLIDDLWVKPGSSFDGNFSSPAYDLDD